MSPIRTFSASSIVKTTRRSVGATSSRRKSALAKRKPFSRYISSIVVWRRLISPIEIGEPSRTEIDSFVMRSVMSVRERRFRPLKSSERRIGRSVTVTISRTPPSASILSIFRSSMRLRRQSSSMLRFRAASSRSLPSTRPR